MATALQRLHPSVEVRTRGVQTEGDRHQGPITHGEGAKGLFTRGVEAAVLAGSSDIAVHSLKDLPTAGTPGLITAAIPKRADSRDVLVGQGVSALDDLPEGARVGTSSPRRTAQLLRVRPDLEIVPLRGNVETRLRKILVEGEADAALLAAAGLNRCGVGDRGVPVPPDQLIPAPGQGALAIQCRADDHVTLRRCLPLNDGAASGAVHAERSIVEALGADCHSPIAVLAQTTETGALRLRARVVATDGGRIAADDDAGSARSTQKLCQRVVRRLRMQGADAILEEARDGDGSR